MAFGKKKEDDLKTLTWRSYANKNELCIYVVRRSAPTMGTIDSVPFPKHPTQAEYQAIWDRVAELKKQVLAMKPGK